jgi:predicted metal-dependent hydrolase
VIETSAHKELRRRALSWAAKLHLSPKTIRFRRMCEKWGTCSYGGTVTLASDLVAQESRFQDFVIVHELVHLKVHQHGRAFNEHMDEHLPGWRAMESLRKRTPATCRTKRSKPRRHGARRSKACRRSKLLGRLRRTRARLRDRRSWRS